MTIDKIAQLKQVEKALTEGGFSLGAGTTTAGIHSISGRMGTQEIRVIVHGLGTRRVSGGVFAYRPGYGAGSYGDTLARFSLSSRGWRMTNNILEYCLERRDPFGG